MAHFYGNIFLYCLYYDNQASNAIFREPSHLLVERCRGCIVAILYVKFEDSATSKISRKTIETMLLDFNNQNISITVSIGACQYSSDIKTKEELIEKADNALYKAKNSGRNQTVLSTCL